MVHLFIRTTNLLSRLIMINSHTREINAKHSKHFVFNYFETIVHFYLYLVFIAVFCICICHGICHEMGDDVYGQRKDNRAVVLRGDAAQGLKISQLEM